MKAYDNRYGTIIKNFEKDFSDWQFESVLDAFSSFHNLKKSQRKKHFGLEYEEVLQSFVVDNAHRIIQFVSLDENSVSQDAVTLKKQSLKNKNKDKIFHLERDGRNDYYIRNGKAIIFYKDRLMQIGESLVPGEPVSDIWDDVLPNDLHNEGGVNLRKGKKPEKLIHRLIEMGTREDELVMDFFMGSGTTAAVSLKAKRKWIGVEHNDYFDAITLKRLKLTLYGDKSGVTEMTMWKGGGCFKYLRLESYEDTLNNLVFDGNPVRGKAIENNPSLKEDYMLRYLLDVETRGSQSLLNIDAFADPTAYSLVVKKPGSDEQIQKNIDLIETFNYLLGLRLEHMAAPQTFTASFTRNPDPGLPKDQHTKLVIDEEIQQATDGKWWFRKLEGWVPADPMNPNNGQKEKVLIVWRKLTDNLEEDNLMLDEWFKKYRITSRESAEFDVIYVNGSNNLPNLKKDEEHWKVRLIEEEFHKLMWSVEGEI